MLYYASLTDTIWLPANFQDAPLNLERAHGVFRIHMYAEYTDYQKFNK